MRVALLCLVLGACVGTSSDKAPTDDTDPVVCPGGGVLAAEIGENTLPTCADVVQRYADVVAAGRPCRRDADCDVLNGACGVGLGGCYEPGGPCAEQGLLDELGTLFSSHSEGCAGPVCDCAEPPDVRCEEDLCTLVSP